MGAGHCANQGQPDTEAAGRWPLGPALESMPLQLRRKTGTVVGHAQKRRPAIDLGSDPYMTTCGEMLHGVVQQVGQRPAGQIGIHLGSGSALFIDLEAQSALLACRVIELDHIPGHLPQVDGLPMKP